MPTSFATNIKPLFTAGDIECMAGMGVKLDDYDWVAAPAGGGGFADHARARNVLARLVGVRKPRMPMGGPYWPDAQVQLFKQWIEEGCQA